MDNETVLKQILNKLDGMESKLSILETRLKAARSAFPALADFQFFPKRSCPLETLKPEEVEQFVQITTSYHEAGRKDGRIEGKEEGREEGKEIGLEMTLKALEAFREGKNIDEVMILTGLERDQLLKI